jgi:type VI secretion system protein ImpK
MDAEQRQPSTIVELCTDFFLLGLQIRSGNVELPACETMKRRVFAMFETLKSRANQTGISPTDLDDVRYALAAYLDEVVQYTDWSGKAEWARRPLQAVLFSEAKAGATFFQRLQEVRRRSQAALEIYYLCMVLGFMGEHRLDTGHDLEELIDDLRRELTQGIGTQISVHGKRPETAGLGGKVLPLVPVAGAVLAVSIAVVVLLFLLLSSGTSDAIKLLEQLGRL